jgi:phage-related minor tail protein
MAASSYARAQRDIALGLTGIGRASGATVSEINSMAEATASAARLSTSETARAITAFASTGRVGREVWADLATQAKDYARLTGTSVDEASQKLAQMFANPAEGAKQLAEQTGAASAGTVKLIESMQRQNRMLDAQQALVGVLKSGLQGVSETTGGWSKAWDAVANSVANAWRWLGQRIDTAVYGQPVEAQLAAAREVLSTLETRAEFLRKRGFTDIQITANTAGIEQARQRVKELEDQLKKAADQAAATKQNLETMRLVPILQQAVPEMGQKEQIQGSAKAVGQLAQAFEALKLGQATEEQKRLVDAMKGIPDAAKWAAVGVERLNEAADSYLPTLTKHERLEQLRIEYLNKQSPAQQAEYAYMRRRIELSGENVSATEKEAAAVRARNEVLQDSLRFIQVEQQRISLLGTLATVSRAREDVRFW